MCVPPCTATTEHIHGQLNDACMQAGRQRGGRGKRTALNEYSISIVC